MPNASLELEPPCSEYKSIQLFSAVAASIDRITSCTTEEYLKEVVALTVTNDIEGWDVTCGFRG